MGSGKRFYKHLVFQGGDRSDLDLSTAAMGKSLDATALAKDRAVDKSGLIRRVPASAVLISFFPVGSHQETPDYEVAAHVFANGINGTMSLIYPDYTLRASLARLEPLKPSC
jgi:hypothetical protein